MAEDIAPELYKEITEQFQKSVQNDSQIKSIVSKVNRKRATAKDITRAAERLGTHASDAMKAVLTAERLPDGVLYWNIADRTVKPVMRTVYDTVNTLALGQKRGADIAKGVKLGIEVGVDPEDRIETLMGMLTSADTPEALAESLEKGVKTTALDYLDDFNQGNARARDAMGIKQYVVREYDGVGLNNGKEPCQWCLERAGTWTYKEAAENGVFERHEGCGCTIEVIDEEDYVDDGSWKDNLPDLPF